MKKFTLSILFILYFFIQSFATDYIKIIFKSKEDIPTSDKKGDSVNIKFHDEKLNEIFKKYKVSKFEKEYPIADSFPDYMTPAVRLRLVYQLRLSEDEKDKIKKLKVELDEAKSPNIDTTLETNDPILLGTPPNDYYNCFACTTGTWPQAHHHLDLINALGAWEITKGLSCIKIGIVDQSFQHHVDLDNKVDITPRTDYIAPANASLTHGVVVAGMAGAETNNNLGISSLGYNIRLQYYHWTYNGIVNAIYDRCKVVNCSWSNDTSTNLQSPPPDVQDVLNLAKLNNVTIVAAAGNMNYGSATQYFYPASYDGVISVTSVGSQYNVGDPANANWKDCHRQFTNPTNSRYNETHQHNDRVDICAPGYWVESTSNNNYYGNTGGTSLAAPLVSAAAALLYSINPFFTPVQIEAYLKNNATNIYGIHDNYLWTGKLGTGRLDAAASLKAALSNAYTGDYCNSCPSETSYLTVTHYNTSPTNLSEVSGYFYNKDIYAGSDNGSVVLTSNNLSTSLVATNSIVLISEFNAVATANSSFSARIEPCSKPVARAIVDNDNNYKKEYLKIYPNPTNNIITITYSIPQEGQVDIEIVNSVGIIVKRLHKSINKLILDKTEIDVRNLQDGLYYVIMRCATKTYTKKFLKIYQSL